MKALFLITTIIFGSVQALADARTEILMDKVERMEAELALLGRKIYQNPPSSAPAVSPNLPSNIDDFYAQLDSQNQLIQELTEKVERLEFEVATLGNRVDKMNADVDFRLSELTPSQETKEIALDKVEKEADKKAYEAAYALLKKGDYDSAGQAFLKFMADYPTSTYLGNANYWLGESYYAQGQYAEAAGLFADGFTKYKDNPKAPDNMLKLGLTMKKLGKKSEACTALKGLADEFPTANEALKKRAQDEAKALQC